MRFAHFEFDPEKDRLGESPQADVFRARDTRLGRTVALKILRPHVEFDPEAAKRFEREARHTSMLAHPNIATIYEYGKTDGGSFIVLEFLEGRALDRVLKERSLSFHEGVRIALQVTSALSLVHKNGLIHRDLKPANIMVLEDGTVKLLDFGICRSTGESSITQDGMLVGTVLYMSPEQVRGEELDVRTDVFSLGAVLYHALTGTLPFPGNNFAEVCMRIVECDPKLPGTVRRGFPEDLAAFLMKCLAEDPTERYSDAASAHGALLTVADSMRIASGAKQNLSLRGQVLIPPLAVAEGRETTRQMAGSLLRDLQSELSRSTELEVALVEEQPTAEAEGAFVVQGSLALEDNKGILTYSLGRARATGRPRVLCSEEIEHVDEDEWGLQAQLVGSLARSLRRHVSEYSAQFDEKSRDPEEARKLAQHAHEILHCGTSKHLMSAVSTFRRALEADPGCALAHAGMAEALVWKYLCWDGDTTFIREAKESARRALSYDPLCAEAHTSMGFANMMTGTMREAERELRLSIQMDHDEFLAHRLLGALLAREGNFKGAAGYLRRAMTLRPGHIGSYDHLYSVLRHMDRYDEALEVADKGIAMAKRRVAKQPRDQEARLHAALLLARIGQEDEARQEIATALERAPKDGYTLFHTACVQALLGDRSSAVESLRQAQARGYFVQSEILRNSDLDSLRELPEFEALLR